MSDESSNPLSSGSSAGIAVRVSSGDNSLMFPTPTRLSLPPHDFRTQLDGQSPMFPHRHSENRTFTNDVNNTSLNLAKDSQQLAYVQDNNIRQAIELGYNMQERSEPGAEPQQQHNPRETPRDMQFGSNRNSSETGEGAPASSNESSQSDVIAHTILHQISLLLTAYDGSYGPTLQILAARFIESLTLQSLSALLRLVAEIEGHSSSRTRHSNSGRARPVGLLVSESIFTKLSEIDPFDQRLQRSFILPSLSQWHFDNDVVVGALRLDASLRICEQDSASRNLVGDVLMHSLFSSCASPVYRICLFSFLFPALEHVRPITGDKLSFTLENFKRSLVTSFNLLSASTNAGNMSSDYNPFDSAYDHAMYKEVDFVWLRLWWILRPGEPPVWAVLRLQKFPENTGFVALLQVKPGQNTLRN